MSTHLLIALEDGEHDRVPHRAADGVDCDQAIGAWIHWSGPGWT